MTDAPLRFGNAFDLLHPKVKDLLRDEGWTAPTAAQKEALPIILDGDHTLLIAPTGIGKTESAMLPVFSELLDRKDRKPSATGIHVIYVTPLRALNRDLLGRLQAWGDQLGIDVRVRHGDTSGSERTRQSRNPPDVLITTPETLQIMFTGRNLRRHLANVRFVIIDEVHELAADERGAQLAAALERVEHLVATVAADAAPGAATTARPGGRESAMWLTGETPASDPREAPRIQRIGLSATVGDPDEVAAYLGGVGRDVRVVKVFVPKALDLVVESPVVTERAETTARKLMCKPEAAAFLNRCLDLIDSHTSTLLFVNTRETAEVLMARIRMLRPDADTLVRVHHGSLSKDVRVEAEEAFKQGVVSGLICTSSMELGIDIGSADLVIQYGSPRQVTRLVQRVGRAGHRADLISNGVILGTDADDVAEALVITKRTLDEQVEFAKSPRHPLDVLANQLAAMALQHGSLPARDTWLLLRRAHPFRDLDWDVFEAVLMQLAGQWVIWYEPGREPGEGPADDVSAHAAGRDGSAHGPDAGDAAGRSPVEGSRGAPGGDPASVPGGSFGAKRRSRTYFHENISMIPDERTFKVVSIVTGRAVATLDEAFVASFIEPSAAFICQGQPWQVVEVDADKGEIRVAPQPDPLGAIPSWIGEEIPVPYEVAQGVGRLRADVRDVLWDAGVDAAVAHVAEAYGAHEDAARRVVAAVEEQGDRVIPTDTVFTMETGAGHVIINAALGTRVNETLGRLIASLLTARWGTSVGLQIDPYRIMLTLPTRARPTQVRETLESLDPATLQQLLEMVLQSSHYLRRRMIHVARKFGALDKKVDYHRVNVARLLDVFKGTPLHREALREVFDEKLDVATARRILEDLRSGHRQLVDQALSPMGMAGLDQKIELVSPRRADRTLLDAMRRRLSEERITLACVNCWDWSGATRVGRAHERRSCPKCAGRLLAAYRPYNETAVRIVKKKGKSGTDEERAEKRKLLVTANLVFDHGTWALLALVARGVGPETAGRLLARARDDDDAFLRDILEAEITYAKTRQFWD